MSEGRKVFGWGVSSIFCAAALAGEPRDPNYGIPPQTLRMLATGADLVVVARVEQPTADETEWAILESGWRRERTAAVHRLDVEDVLKGEIAKHSLFVSTDLLGSPAPAEFEPGSRVLVFLDPKPRGGVEVHARSWGVKQLDDEELPVWVARTQEQLAILGIPDPAARRRAQVDWLLRCIEHPATRWDGAYELVPDFAGGWRLESDDLPFRREPLTEPQRLRVRDAFLSARTFGPGEQCLEVALRGDPDPRIEAWLLKRIRTLRERDPPAIGRIRTLVLHLNRRSPRPGTRALVEEILELSRFLGHPKGERPAKFVEKVDELLGHYESR